MILDLERPDCPTAFDCDVAIVGAGAVGLTMAVDLARRGVDVLLLEGGGRNLETSSQAINQAYSVGHPLGGLHDGRFRLLGGTTNFWGGQIIRFDPIVFESRPWIGSKGWPFGRGEIDRYYDRCSRMLGLPGALDDQAVWKRLAISTPDFGAGVELFLTRWLREPILARVFRTELASPALRTLVHANVVGIASDEARDRTSGLRVKTLAGKTADVRATRVVLACGTIEISRLLMQPLSDGGQPPWAANAWLGRGFLDHVHCNAGRVRILDKKRFHRVFDNLYVDRLKYNPKLKLSPLDQAEAQTLEIAGQFSFRSDYGEHLDNLKLFVRSILNGRMSSKARQLPAHIAALWKVALPLAVRYLRSSRAFNPSDGGVDLHLTAEQWPNPESRIVLRDERDDLGLTKVAVDWAIDGREIETMAHFAERVRNVLLRLGLADIDLDPRLVSRDPEFLQTVVDEYHQMGGARIGSSPNEGVVDANLKVHGSENLYVAGAAVYPSSGFGNPTFTAMALGLRLCEHLIGPVP